MKKLKENIVGIIMHVSLLSSFCLILLSYCPIQLVFAITYKSTDYCTQREEEQKRCE